MAFFTPIYIYIIAFLAVLKHFPTSKTYFWPYLKLQKMEFRQIFLSEIDLFDFGLDFFKFYGPLCIGLGSIVISSIPRLGCSI